MKTPDKVNSLICIATCVGITQTEWNKFMNKTVKANGTKIRKLIKEHLPDLYESLCLDFPNPFEHKCVKKQNLLVYVHSGIEYFLKFE